jgi:bacterioferritin
LRRRATAGARRERRFPAPPSRGPACILRLPSRRSWRLDTGSFRMAKKKNNKQKSAQGQEGFEGLDVEAAIRILNHVLELELAGVVRYMHYSFMIFGHNRIPIVKWLREEANESLAHAEQAGEHVTSLGGHPSLEIGDLLETHKHHVDEILAESYAHESQGLQAYQDLLALVRDRSVFLEEYAREMIAAEQAHLNEIRKMMRRPL